MREAIEGLQPALLWEHFYGLTQIPRGSKNEAAAARHVVELAQRAGLECRQDEAGNVVVRKPASPGREGAPTVVLQGHLDMVCEKNAEVAHDFERDPLRLLRDDGWIRADGTTLGADNGIGVAAALAVMEDRTLVHGPLEMLFTIDEETGLTGANALSPDLLQGRVLLNLDSEEDGSLYVGCAGGRDSTFTFHLKRRPAPAGRAAATLQVSGLKGGHSGLDIHEGRGNALQLLARFLCSPEAAAFRLRLLSLGGGNKRNAIPREAVAGVLLAARRIKALAKAASAFEATWRHELGDLEPNLSFRVSPEAPAGAPADPLVPREAERFTRFLYALHHGVIGMSRAIPGLVETSTNLAAVQMEGDSFRVLTSQRSSSPARIREIVERVGALGHLAGAEVLQGGGYPGWNPNMDSRVLAVLRQTHEALFGRMPEVKAIHAGLECGIIGEKYPGMDMISFGPTIHGAHSPDERVETGTVDRFWKLLTGVLDDLSKG